MAGAGGSGVGSATAGVLSSGCEAGAGVSAAGFSAAGALVSGCAAGAVVSAAGFFVAELLFFDGAAGVAAPLDADFVVDFAKVLLFAELPVGSPAFQVSEAGTLKEMVFPSEVAMIVPSSSVRYTATPFVRRVFRVSAWG